MLTDHGGFPIAGEESADSARFSQAQPVAPHPIVRNDVRNRPHKNSRMTPPSHLATSTRHDVHPPASQLQSPNPNPAPTQPPRLLDRVRAEIRTRHYSLRTEQAYVGWARQFILFHGKRTPKTWDRPRWPLSSPT